MREAVVVRALSAPERAELEQWISSGDEDAVRRARIVLLSDERLPLREIATAVDSHVVNVKKWIRRFNEEGLAGLREMKRGPKKGTRSRFSEEQERAILALASASPRAAGLDFDRWSPQKVADAAVARGIVDGISHVTVRAMLRAAGLGEPDIPAAPSDGGNEGAAPKAAPASGRTSALVDAGRAALEWGENREAVEKFRAALATTDGDALAEANVRCLLATALEGLASYDEALEAVKKYEDAAVLAALPIELRGRVKIRLGWAYSWLRNYPRAVARLNEASKIYQETGDERGLAEIHFALGRTYVQFNESSMARDHLERAIQLQRNTDNKLFLAQVYSRLGLVEFNEGDVGKATDIWEHARSLVEGSRNDNLLGEISLNLAVACLEIDRGDRVRATKDLERAIFHFERGGHHDFLAQAYNNLGHNLFRAGDWKRALDALEYALEIAGKVGDARASADPLVTIGEIALRQGRFEVAEAKLSEALELLRRVEDRWGEAYTLRALASLYGRMGEPEKALQTLRDSLHLSTVIKDLRGVTSSHLLLAELHVGEARYEQAQEYIELARAALKADPSQLRSSGLAQRLSGRLDIERGRYAEAQQQLAQSISIFSAVADVYELGLSHLEMGDLFGRTRDLGQSRHHLDQAVEAFMSLEAAPDLARAEELRARPVGTVAPPPDAAAGAFAGSRASDLLLMQRLMDASAARDLLLQELVSIVEENFDPGRILLLEQPEDGGVRVDVSRGFTPDEAQAVAREVDWTLSSGGRLASGGAVFSIDDRTGTRIVLYVDRTPPDERLRPLLRQAELGLENCALRDLNRRSSDPPAIKARAETVIPGFIYTGAAMREVIERIHKIRTSDVTVLITGESGTGKELVARAIHADSERRRAAFLPFNCTATPKEIIDSQLFGHRRGAFTGATSNYMGIIRAAEGGTLFLDEIGDLALEVQPKLLRFLESDEIQPLGEAKPAKVDVRVVAATNNDLERAVEEGRFREDLFHRLNIIRIHVPPLRDRREEIPVLADFFLTHFAQRVGKAGLTLAPDALAILSGYTWPGNVRQLRNEMERVVAYTPAGVRVGADDLSPELSRGGTFRSPRADSGEAPVGGGLGRGPGKRQTLKEATLALERTLIQEALARSGNNLTAAAHDLGLSHRGLHLKMSQLGIARVVAPTA